MLIDYSKDALPHPSLGFRFRPETVNAEITAINTVVDGSQRALLTGYVDPKTELPKFIQALKDAGYGPEKSYDKGRVSVILGVTGAMELVIPLGARLGHPIWRSALKDAGVDDTVAEDVVQRIAEGYVPWQENSFPGLLGNVVAGRISKQFDLGGTNCVVDAACASSLSALHLAALELASGKSDMVVTGGVDTFNDIFMYMCFSKTPALSPGGHARPFEAEGDGTTLGEGLGIVVLKRLADAERDGERDHRADRRRYDLFQGLFGDARQEHHYRGEQVSRHHHRPRRDFQRHRGSPAPHRGPGGGRTRARLGPGMVGEPNGCGARTCETAGEC